ncbi:MAG: hypothetical protein WBB29_04760 [Geitlerinemataceae cyanobacterium]
MGLTFKFYKPPDCAQFLPLGNPCARSLGIYPSCLPETLLTSIAIRYYSESTVKIKLKQE